MKNMNDMKAKMELLQNEILIFEPIEDNFHPIEWLDSIGQYMTQKSEDRKIIISSKGMKSVQFEVL